MAKKCIVFMNLPIIAVLVLMLVGCNDFGKVEQGRTIAYDKANKTLTIIKDKSTNPKKPDYSTLPPITYKLPDDPGEMGPEPKVGKRMKLDLDKKEIVIFDTASAGFVKIPYTVVEQKDNVDANNPLVIDEKTKKAKSFPVIDDQQKTITLYSKRQKVLVKFTVADQYFSYPADTWDSGDEVRIYYKEEGKARRIMNVSKTDIFKK